MTERGLTVTYSELPKQYWREKLTFMEPQVRPVWKSLVTSVADAYGRRARFDYVDGLSGISLRHMHRLDELDVAGMGLKGGIQEVLNASLYPRLVRLVDAVGAESLIEYGCGYDAQAGAEGVRSITELRSRQQPGPGSLYATCLSEAALEDFGGGPAGSRWLFRRVAATITPYGRTQFHRILRREQDADGYAVGWVIEDPVGDLQRYETAYGNPSVRTRQWLHAWIDAERAAGRNVQLQGLPAGLPEYVARSGAEGLRQLYRMVTGSDPDTGAALAGATRTIEDLKEEWSYRNSYYWSSKALEQVYQLQRPGADAVPPRPWRREDVLSATEWLPLQVAHVTHHLHDRVPGQSRATLSPLVMAEKHPLTGFVYLAYQGQASANEYRNGNTAETLASKPALVLSDAEAGGALHTQVEYREYNGKGRLQRVWDNQGQGQQLEYAANDVDVVRVQRLRPGTRTADGAPSLSLGYNVRGQLEWARDEQGYEHRYTYEDNWPYRLRSSSVPLEQGSAAEGLRPVDVRYRTLTYQTQGPVYDASLAQRQPVQARTTVRITDGHGQTVIQVYENGLLASERTPQQVVQYDYADVRGAQDGFGRVQRVYVNDALQTSYEYAGLDLEAVTDASGNRLEYGYDHLGRVAQVEVKDVSGQRVGWTSLEYDRSGAVRLYRKLGNSGMYGYLQPQAVVEYDVLGRPVSRTDQDGARTELDYEANSGKLKQTIDAAGVVSRYAYDRHGRLSLRQVIAPGEGVVDTLALDYEPEYGRLERVTNNGEVRRYEYQRRGMRYAGVLGNPLRLLRSSVPFRDGSGATHAVTTEYQGYDASGRLLGYRVHDDLGNDVPYMQLRLDGLGRVQEYANEVSRLRFDYEGYDVAAEAYGRVLGMRYDLDGEASQDELVQRTDYYRRSDFTMATGTDAGFADVPQLGMLKVLSYHPGSRPADAALPSGLGAAFRSMHYGGNGRLERVDGYLGGLSRSYGYDGAGRLTRSERHQGRARLGGWSYAYDENGNPLHARELDGLGQERPWDQQQQTYGLSNRLHAYQERDAQGVLRVPECKPDLQKGLAHDAMGRLLQDPVRCATRYYWDARGHLVRVQYDEANWTEITWNGLNQYTRIVEVVNGNPKDDKTYVWPMAGNAPAQVRDTPTGRLVMSFNGDGYQTYAYDEWGNVQTRRYIMLRDHLGSVIGLVDERGRQIEAVEYDDWGNITARRSFNEASGQLEDVGTARTHTASLPLQYAGLFWLKRADLALTPNRVYHPRIQRWLSRDPIGEAGGDGNLYAYVFNAPNQFIDPDGLAPRNPQECLRLFAALIEQMAMRRRETTVRDMAAWRAFSLTPAAGAYQSLTPDQQAGIDVALRRPAAGGRTMQQVYLEEILHERQIQTRYRARALRYYCGDDNDRGPGSPTDGFNPDFNRWLEGRVRMAQQAGDGTATRSATERFWAHLADGHYPDQPRVAPYDPNTPEWVSITGVVAVAAVGAAPFALGLGAAGTATTVGGATTTAAPPAVAVGFWETAAAGFLGLFAGNPFAGAQGFGF